MSVYIAVKTIQNLSIFAIFPHPYFSVSLVEFASYLCKHFDLTFKKKRKKG